MGIQTHGPSPKCVKSGCTLKLEFGASLISRLTFKVAFAVLTKSTCSQYCYATECETMNSPCHFNVHLDIRNSGDCGDIFTASPHHFLPGKVLTTVRVPLHISCSSQTHNSVTVKMSGFDTYKVILNFCTLIVARDGSIESQYPQILVTNSSLTTHRHHWTLATAAMR